MTLGEKIYQARIAAGMSRPDLKRSLGIPVRTLEDWESDQHKPPSYVATLLIEWLERRKNKE